MVQKQISSAPEREREKTTWPRTHRLEKLMNNWTIVYERTEPSALGSSRQLLASWMNLKHRHRMRFIYQIRKAASTKTGACWRQRRVLDPSRQSARIYRRINGWKMIHFRGMPKHRAVFQISKRQPRGCLCRCHQNSRVRNRMKYWLDLVVVDSAMRRKSSNRLNAEVRIAPLLIRALSLALFVYDGP